MNEKTLKVKRDVWIKKRFYKWVIKEKNPDNPLLL
jgi:hypothetical protein